MFRPYFGHLQVVTLYTSKETTLSLHEKHYSLVSLLDGSSVGPVGTSFVGAEVRGGFLVSGVLLGLRSIPDATVVGGWRGPVVGLRKIHGEE
jgi:hypothetical protein